LNKAPDAVIDVIQSFFQRPDLTAYQQSFYNHAMAGAYLFSGTASCRMGNRRLGLKWLWKALRLEPKAVFTTRRGWGLLYHIFSPIYFKPYQLRNLTSFPSFF
jgi:hypothetical protein